MQYKIVFRSIYIDSIIHWNFYHEVFSFIENKSLEYLFERVFRSTRDTGPKICKFESLNFRPIIRSYKILVKVLTDSYIIYPKFPEFKDP